MALDFPTSPTNGQKYPQPPVAGQPVYTWDGEKWKAAGSGVIPTIMVSDSPPTNPPDNALWWESDSGLLYLRYNDGDTSQWVIAAPQPDISLFFNSPTFTGNPTAPTPAVGDNDTSIATTAYVHSEAVMKVGDTMTGDLTIDKASPLIKLAKSATAQNIAIAGFNVGLPRWSLLLGTDDLESGSNAGSDFRLNRFSDAGAFVDTPIAVVRGTGAVTINADPTTALGVATKQYVDARGTAYLQNSVVFDPPSQATNVVGVIQTLTVTGAALGDFCQASFSVDLNGMILVAWVSAANTVKFQFQNKTAGTLDLASGTVRVRVWKQ